MWGEKKISRKVYKRLKTIMKERYLATIHIHLEQQFWHSEAMLMNRSITRDPQNTIISYLMDVCNKHL